MLTLRQAAELLHRAANADGRLALTRAFGLAGEALPADDDVRAQFGLSREIRDLTIVCGAGSLRGLTFRDGAARPLRESLAQAAHELSRRTTRASWLLVAFAEKSNEVGIACWQESTRGPRLSALVCDRERIVASDAEVVAALAGAHDGGDLLVHARWNEILGRETLSRRFYRTLEQRVRGLADSLVGVPVSERHELALLNVSRLLFLSFLEAKGWLNCDRRFLSGHFDRATHEHQNFHERVLLPLFFGTLNTPVRRRSARAAEFGDIPFLNGGLFARSALERRHAVSHFSNEAMGALFGDVFDKYRFTAREGHDIWTEAAVDPEMLGRAFESLMASRERRNSGAFYTPHEIVSQLTERSLVVALGDDAVTEESVRRALAGQRLGTTEAGALRARLQSFTVLDPACGSGAFLVHVLERLADLHQLAGDERPLSVIRRDIAGRCIHGVDVNPTAVWLCELRLWLSVVIESEESLMSRVPPLPNLDCSVRVGDALAGEAFNATCGVAGPSLALSRLRDRYIRATGPRKAPLRRALAREERRRALAVLERQLVAITANRRERLLLRRSADLFGERSRVSSRESAEMRSQRVRAAALRRERRRISEGGALSFSFPSHFGTAHGRGGFDLVIGNPPWVRLHNIPLAARSRLREQFAVFRNAAWEDGMGDAARGFASQVDLAALFVERSAALASATGAIALLLPAKLWRSLAGGGMRGLVSAELAVRAIGDLSDAPSAFDAAVYPSFLVASRNRDVKRPAVATVRGRSLSLEWDETPEALPLVSGDGASPWLILPPDVRAAFDRLVRSGHPFRRTGFGRAMLGVKCGLNEAFVVEVGKVDADTAEVGYRGRSGAIERQVVRPLVRGDTMHAWRVPPNRDGIVWTHDGAGIPLRALPAGAARWLGPWRRQLSARSDLRGSMRWWSLFRTEGADSARCRVVWSDFGRVPKAAVLPAGDPTVPLNSCYVVSCSDEIDALALATLLNSPVAAAWLNVIAEPARGGWRRYLAWTVSLLPIPREWNRARDILAPLAARAIEGDPPSAHELIDVTCKAYRLKRESLAPLLAWSHSTTEP